MMLEHDGKPLREYELYRGVYCFSPITAFDREQAIKFFKEEFKNDDDIAKVRITRILSKMLEGGEKIYAIFFRLDGSGILEKPKCVECGSDEVISKGISWYCKNCGRWFIKKRRYIGLTPRMIKFHYGSYEKYEEAMKQLEEKQKSKS